MSRSSSLLAHNHDAARLTGDRAADVDQVALRVDLFDAKVRLGVALVAEVARHALALDDAGGIGARSDGPGTTVLRVAVGVGTTTCLVALHDTLEAAALRGASDLDGLSDLEDVDLYHIADAVLRNLDLCVARLVEPNAAEDCRRCIETGFLRLADFGEVRATTLWILRLTFRRVTPQPLRAEAELNGRVSILLQVGHGQHRIRLGRDDRDRNLLSLFVEDLGHAQFLADYANHSCHPPPRSGEDLSSRYRTRLSAVAPSTPQIHP